MIDSPVVNRTIKKKLFGELKGILWLIASQLLIMNIAGQKKKVIQYVKQT